MTRARGVVAGLVLAALLAVAVSSWGCHGHVIRKPFVPNHAADFDFTRPPCAAAPRPDAAADDVLLRYLGVGGLYVEWRGEALLTAPYFSAHGLFASAFGSVRIDRPAVERGLEGLPLQHVQALLVGHTHFDHFADLPAVLEAAPHARVYVNSNGVKMLAAFPELEQRVIDVEPLAGGWIRLHADDGRPLPFRVMPIPSGHADHFAGYHYARGAVAKAWDHWEGQRLSAMKEGQVFAYLIDLLDADDEVAFRMHHHDSASSAPGGFPPASIVDEHPVDLVVTCLPGSWMVEDYPRGVLEATRAAHVLVGHYEDFFRSRDRPLRFVALLRNGRADNFLHAVQREMSRDTHQPRGPQPRLCGPCGDAWSMPLPGEWLCFPAQR